MHKYRDELRTKKRKKLIFQLAFFCIVAIAGFIGLIYAMFFAGFLDVRTVAIEAPDGLHADIGRAVGDWLDSGTWKFTKRKNIFFFSANKLSAQLAGQFPKLEFIQVSKKLPHSLTVSGSERRPAGVWCLSGQERCFYFDKNGMAFSETQPSSGFLVLNIVDQRSRELKLGNEVAAQNWLSNIAKTKELLAKFDVNILEFIIPADSFDEFYAKTAEGWRILFSNATDIEKQISALSVFIKNKLNPGQRPTLQYIDLRIQDRIYYK